jgi:hypothetical protein
MSSLSTRSARLTPMIVKAGDRIKGFPKDCVDDYIALTRNEYCVVSLWLHQSQSDLEAELPNTGIVHIGSCSLS